MFGLHFAFALRKINGPDLRKSANARKSRGLRSLLKVAASKLRSSFISPEKATSLLTVRTPSWYTDSRLHLFTHAFGQQIRAIRSHQGFRPLFGGSRFLPLVLLPRPSTGLFLGRSRARVASSSGISAAAPGPR